MTFYELLADIIVAVHLAYMAYIGLGQLAIMIGWPLGWQWIRNPWFRVSHLVMILIVAVEAVVGYQCPLTTWESELRTAAGQVPDDMTFVAKVLRFIMFPSVDEGTLKLCYYTIAGIVFATVVLVPPRFRKRPTNPPPSDPVPGTALGAKPPA